MTDIERTWDAEMESVLGDYEGAEPLPFPLESMAASIYSDWGRSMAEARAYIEAARRIGARSVVEKVKPTLAKTRPALGEAAETIERLTKVCEDALRWFEWFESDRPTVKRGSAGLVRELRKVLGKGAQ